MIGRPPKGHPKWGGRQKGTPNRNKDAFADRLKELNIDLIDEIFVLIRDVSENAPGKQSKLNALIQMLHYVYPSKKAMSLTPEQEYFLIEVQRFQGMPIDQVKAVVIQDAARRIGIDSSTFKRD